MADITKLSTHNILRETKLKHWTVYRREEAIKRLLFIERPKRIHISLFAERSYKHKINSKFTAKDVSIWSYD